MRPFVLALVVTACAAPPQELPSPLLPQRAGVDETVALRAEGVRYMAVGEDHFILRIYDDRISVARHGEEALDFPQTEPRYPRWNGEIYESEANGHRLRVDIRHYRECGGRDGRDTVAVTLDGAAMTGCGRAF
jgi:hypothetical protein